MNYGKLTNEEYKSIYSKVPRLCIDLIVVQDDGILLSLRSIEPHKGKWHIPGGRVYYKESVDDAIARVSEAEIGITVTKERLLGYIEFMNDGEYVHSVSLVFLCKNLSKQKPISLEQSSKIETFKEIPDNILSEHGEFLNSNLGEILK